MTHALPVLVMINHFLQFLMRASNEGCRRGCDCCCCGGEDSHFMAPRSGVTIPPGANAIKHLKACFAKFCKTSQFLNSILATVVEKLSPLKSVIALKC